MVNETSGSGSPSPTTMRSRQTTRPLSLRRERIRSFKTSSHRENLHYEAVGVCEIESIFGTEIAGFQPPRCRSDRVARQIRLGVLGVRTARELTTGGDSGIRSTPPRRRYRRSGPRRLASGVELAAHASVISSTRATSCQPAFERGPAGPFPTVAGRRGKLGPADH